MIFNTGGSNNSISAESVKYGDSNVAQELDLLGDELTANNTKIYMDYKDGKYGYNTDPLRGADTFNPFSSGGTEFTNLTTVTSIKGNQLPIITGSGYITIRRTGGNGNSYLNIFIDGNTQPFRIDSNYSYGAQGGFNKLFFQESIRFENGNSNDTYFYQTLLSDKLLPKKYRVIQGVAGTDYTTITGKGKILVSPSYANPAIYYTLDNIENWLSFYGYQYMEFMFNESFIFQSNYESYPLYYIAYLEI